MAVPIGQVYRRAEHALARGEAHPALADFVRVLEAEPRFTRTWLRIGDALLDLGEKQPAGRCYQRAFWDYARGGDPLRAAVALKMLEKLRPVPELTEIFGALYAADGGRVDTTCEVAAGTWQGAAVAAEDGTLSSVALLVSAVETLLEGPERPAQKALPPMPLFSDLSSEDFGPAFAATGLVRWGDAERILREGDAGGRMFVVAHGRVIVSRFLDGEEVMLTELGAGAVLGEMALVTGGPRTASARSLGPVDALVLSGATLSQWGQGKGALGEALRRFTQSRLLANLAATSPILKALPRPEQRALLSRFRRQPIRKGTVCVEAGTRARSLCLVVRGTFEVRAAGAAVAVLEAGDVFGEISLFTGRPARASVHAASDAEILGLSDVDLEAVLEAFPALARYLETLCEMRLSRESSAREGRTA